MESKLGLTPPADYRWFIETYGSGRLGELTILSPFTVVPGMNLYYYAEDHLAARDEDLEDLEDDEEAPALYPKPGGLLPFGYVEASVFHWETSGPSQDWKVVLEASRSFPDVDPLGFTFLEFLKRPMWSTAQCDA